MVDLLSTLSRSSGSLDGLLQNAGNVSLTSFDEMPKYLTDYMVHILSPDRDIYVRAYMPEVFSSYVTADFGTPFASNLLQSRTKQLIMQAIGIAPVIQMQTMKVYQSSGGIAFNMPMNFLLDTDVEKDVIKPLRDLYKLTMLRRFDANSGKGGGVGNSGQNTGPLLQTPGPKLRYKAGKNVGDTFNRLQKGLTAQFASTVTDGAQLLGGAVQDTFNSLTGSNINAIPEYSSDKFFQDLQNAASNLNVFGDFEIWDNILFSLGEWYFLPSVVITSISNDYQIKLDRKTKRPIAISVDVGIQSWIDPIADDFDEILPSSDSAAPSSATSGSESIAQTRDTGSITGGLPVINI